MVVTIIYGLQQTSDVVANENEFAFRVIENPEQFIEILKVLLLSATLIKQTWSKNLCYL